MNKEKKKLESVLNFWAVVVSHQYLLIFLIYSLLVEERMDKGRRQKGKVILMSPSIYTRGSPDLLYLLTKEVS